MLGYRSFVNVPSCDGDLTGLVLSQLHSWLRSKRYDADALTVGEDVKLAHDVQAMLVDRAGQDGHTTRFHLTEPGAQGRWVTDLTIHEPAGLKRPPVIWIDVQSPDDTYIKTPRLARQILDVVDAYDGSAHLTAAPALVRADGVDAMVDVICDPDRRGLAFIAGSDHSLPLDRWSELVKDLLVDTSGLAAAYVLDADATRLFEDMVGTTHAVQPGTVRTYLPDADPADPTDAFRHRILSTGRILRGDSARLRRTLGWKARDLSLTQPLPRWATRLGESLETTIDAVVVSGARRPLTVATPISILPTQPVTGVSTLDQCMVEATDFDTVTAEEADSHGEPVTEDLATADEVAAPSVIDLTIGSQLVAELEGNLNLRVTDADQVASVVELVLDGLRLRQVQEASRSRLEDLQAQLRSAKEQQAALQNRLDDEVVDHAITTRDGLSALEDVKALQMRLMQAGHGAAAWGVDSSSDVDGYPETFEDLLVRMGQFENVVFTGDSDVTVELDRHADVNTWASKTYQSLKALSDYAVCKTRGEVEGDFEMYLRNPPPGRTGWSINRHARDESSDVKSNPKYAKPRMLPVPASVDPSEVVLMVAHVKIGKAGMISPRLHYYDDTSYSGNVYVGYIGRHLPTQQGS